MTCKFSIGRRFSIDNLRIVDWLDTFRTHRFSQNCLRIELITKLNEEGGEALRPLGLTFRLYTSEAMGAQNYYYLKANDVDAINDFSGTVSEVCADL